ncbi:protein of unknown function [Plantibacter sp. VKM Ac-1784]|uniref:DUF4395 domain-containing protein n=1 Tax=Plantibacter elymi (nom. nud.) TaxID=199708 RepID=A0ABY1RGR2_9MICO|nr:DUF4395 domain-containing protein [Plantibacter sp. VKM Ac-1784]SMQ70396.1 protein of unknown function [Plantibacter sp. VKM Ac-1784]
MTSNPPAAQPTGIDPRSPRFGATITAALLLVAVFLALTAPFADTLAVRAGQPAFVLLSVIAALFAWGAFAGIRRHPYGVVFRRLIRPRLGPPVGLEAPEPPTFAQGVGLVVVAIGLVLHLIGVPGSLVVSAGAAFVAAFLNAALGFCLGCRLYVLLLRARVVGRQA